MELRRAMQRSAEEDPRKISDSFAAGMGSAESSRRAVFERGLAGWLLCLWRRRSTPAARLTLIDRMVIGPRQTLVLIEADGVRLLLATASEGPSTFFALHPAAAVTQTVPNDSPKVAESRGMGLVDKPEKLNRSDSRLAARTGSSGRVSW